VSLDAPGVAAAVTDEHHVVRRVKVNRLALTFFSTRPELAQGVGDADVVESHDEVRCIATEPASITGYLPPVLGLRHTHREGIPMMNRTRAPISIGPVRYEANPVRLKYRDRRPHLPGFLGMIAKAIQFRGLRQPPV